MEEQKVYQLSLCAKLIDTTHYTTTGKLNGRAEDLPALSAKLIDMTHYTMIGKLIARAEVFPAAVSAKSICSADNESQFADALIFIISSPLPTPLKQ